LTLSGTETSSGSGVLITLSSGLVAGSLSVNVWYSTLPVTVALSRVVLRPIFGWMNSSSNSRNVYQRATVSASASFSRPGSTAFVADGTSIILSVLSVSNGSVAFLDSQSRVTGIASGIASVLVTVNGAAFGRASFVVDANKLANVIALSVLPVQSVSVALTPVMPARLSAVVASVSVRTGPLSFEGDSQSVVTSAVFDDQTLMEVGVSDGVIFWAGDPNLSLLAASSVVRVATAASNNSTSFVFASLQPSGSCSSSVVGVGNTTFNVSLDAVSGISVLVQQPVLAVPSDTTAIVVGLPTSSGYMCR